MPTALVGMPASRRMRSANGTWYEGTGVIFCAGSFAPLEQQMYPTPASFSARATITASSGLNPPSTQSVTDMRAPIMTEAGIAARTARAMVSARRIRFSSGPPQWSVRLLERGERNWCTR